MEVTELLRHQLPKYISLKLARELGVLEKFCSRNDEKGYGDLLLNYHTVPCDVHGWVDVWKFLPVINDLCKLRIVQPAGKEIIAVGWWQGGGEWWSRSLKSDSQVTHWKKMECL